MSKCFITFSKASFCQTGAQLGNFGGGGARIYKRNANDADIKGTGRKKIFCTDDESNYLSVSLKYCS